MRPTFVALLGLALLLGLPGCTSPAPAPPAAPTLDAASIVAPKAEIVRETTGAIVRWLGPLELDSPFQFTVPVGTTRVDAQLDGVDGPAALSLFNAFTDRIRCQPDRVVAWFTTTTGTARCGGLAQVDPLPTSWKTSSSFAFLEAGETLTIRLSSEPLDGQAAQIMLANLSMPQFAELETQSTSIPSSIDQEPLWIDYTLPAVEGKVPTILVSSPYNQATRLAGLRPQNSTVSDWVPRGYAVVNADVRGFGKSGGCVEVWGPKEQQDQVDIVEWIAGQPWSDGKVGFYGQSYVGTTPVEAASLAAPHLTTILTIAPVINAYEDWHFGGVPNGENTGSPNAYQSSDTTARADRFQQSAANGDPEPLDMVDLADQAKRGFCDPTLTARANDPRAVYDEFYRERDFKLKASNVKASVFYTQGFYDTNVKSQMIPGWFEALAVPKKALFGDWIHQHPPRADQELLFHAWLDQFLQGRDTGILDTPVVEVRTNLDTIRTDETWPPVRSADRGFGLVLKTGGNELVDGQPGAGVERLLINAVPQPPEGSVPQLPGAGDLQRILWINSSALPDRAYVAGLSHVDLRVKLEGADNAYLYAQLRDLDDADEPIVSFGMLNLALREDYSQYQSMPAGQFVDVQLPLLAAEYVVPAGHRLGLLLRTVYDDDWGGAGLQQTGILTIDGAGSSLVLPTLPSDSDRPLPKSVGPNAIPR